jgi:hypothetical protein
MSDAIERLQELVDEGRLDQVALEITRMRARREFLPRNFENFISHRFPGILMNRYFCRQPGFAMEKLTKAFPDWDAKVRTAALDGTLPTLMAMMLRKVGVRGVRLVIPADLVNDHAAATAAQDLRHTYTCPTTMIEGYTYVTVRRRDDEPVSRADVNIALAALAQAAAPGLPGARLREIELAFSDDLAREEC